MRSRGRHRRGGSDDEFGWPYQPLFSFPGERINGLVYDDDGHVMAYRNTAEGDPLVEESTWQPAPEPIAAAAEEWWQEWRRTLTGRHGPPAPALFA